MLWLIVGSLLFGGLEIASNWGLHFDIRSYVCTSLKVAGMALFGLIVGLAAWIFIGGTIGLILVPAQDAELYDSYPIFTLTDSIEYNGRFILGTGSTSGEIKYYFFEDSDDGYMLRESEAKNTYIIYIDDGEQPRLERHSLVKARRWWIACQIFHDDVYKLFVPEGTIQVDYRIDLQ